MRLCRIVAVVATLLAASFSWSVVEAAKPPPPPLSGTIVIDPWYAPYQQHWGDDIRFDITVSLGTKDGAFVELNCYLDSESQVSSDVGPEWHIFNLPIAIEESGYCSAKLRVVQWIGGNRYQVSYPDEVTFPVACYCI